MMQSLFEEQIKKWIPDGANPENTVVTFVPHSDRMYRYPQVQEMLERIGLQSILVSLKSRQIEDARDWRDLLDRECKTQKKVVLVITDAEYLFSELSNLQSVLAQEYIQRQNHVLLLCSEITPPPETNQTLMQRQSVYGLYPRELVSVFASTLAERFQVKLSEREIDQIYAMCGGFLWLVKHAIRLRAGMPLQEVWTDPSMQGRLLQIYTGFSTEQRGVLAQVCFQESISDRESYDYLQKLGIISNKKIACVLLENCIRNSGYEHEQLQVKKDDIYLNGLCITHLLSERTRILLCFLLKQRQSFLSRATVSQRIFETDVISEEVLDQSIRRFREEIKKIGIRTIQLRTIRGKGYYVEA